MKAPRPHAVGFVLALALGVAAACADLAAFAGSDDQALGLPQGVRALGPPDSIAARGLRGRGQPFGPGERCRFTVEYGPVKAGTATLEVLPMVQRGEHTCYHLASTAQSAPFFDSIYRVRDRIDTMVDAQRFVTYQYQKVQNEGGYHAEQKAAYDPEHGRVRYADGTTMTTPLHALDVLSAFYRARIEKLTPGLSIYIPHHSDRKSFYLEVHVVRREKVEVPAGSFNCVVVEPLVRDAGPFKNKGGLTVWLTDDARHLPVLMKSRVPVGSVDAVLQSYTPGGIPPTGGAQASSSAGL
ncbi:MAG TPA: DUF3108 domain-containing protein [Candidatus Eisenbacteria bacterium]|nr:DUF3108 domain-containing protein [Candidatus Eisenbacteria bacterium]